MYSKHIAVEGSEWVTRTHSVKGRMMGEARDDDDDPFFPSQEN